ncbi:MAG: AAA family ATPase [Gemmatimonadaceae bacterium]|nr:AAA family ATPase [Gemmatimonadaceae bacterium]
MAVRRPDLLEVLEIGAGLATVMGQVHARRIIHKNLSPHSVWYDQSRSEIRLTDFSIAGRIADDGYQIPLAGHIEGLLTHIAPEQTGRLVRVVDHRADHYAIGIILYQLLTGRLPFSSVDPLQIVHAHLARIPTAPHELDAAIPAAVSGIVMKLLAKAPDERYQSAYGLRADLLSCAVQLRASARVEAFLLGTHDSFETFQISQRLYGRDAAHAALFEAFARTAKGATQLVLVRGAPGAGKSVLVNELQKTILGANGHYVSGKFDQYRNDVPYAGIVRALRDLVGQILSRSDHELAAWREKLLAAIGSRGQVLVDVIPALELITGPCPPVPSLPVEEDRNRFNFVFRDFTRALADAAHPLVLFLDDLQWVDAGSLSLLQLLLTDPATQHLLVVGAYRDGEVQPGSRLLGTLDALESDNVHVQRIDLPPLAVEHVQGLVQDTLRCGESAAHALAELVHKKTEGNPFFVSQFLQFLYDEGLLAFDREFGRWTWDLERIESEGITDDVVDLMTTRITRLSEEGQRTLKLAAFLGNEFTLRTIATVCERTSADVLQELRSARREGLLVARADRAGAADLRPHTGEGNTFRFLHDRVQQAAYALTPQAERAAIHVQIGRLLQAAMSAEELALAPFEVVNNLNRGIDLLTGADERRQLAELNRRAARRAQSTTAYDAALTYLNTGLSLLGDDCWERDYDLAYDLYSRRLQVDFVTGAFDAADRTFAVLRAKVTDPIDRAYVATQKIIIDTASDRADAAIALGLAALRELGVRIPAKANAVHVIVELVKNRLMMLRRRPTHLVNLPEMSDRRLQAVLQILKVISVAAYIQNPYLMALIAAKITNMSIRFGNGPASPQGYVLHGLVIGSLTGDYQAGYDFGQAAVTPERTLR